MNTDVGFATDQQIQNCLSENFIASRLILIKKIFNVQIVRSNRVYEKVRNKYDKTLFENKNKDIYFDGYFQSYKYFNNINQRLLDEFTPKNTLEIKNQKILEEIKTTNSVAISIRQGSDYIKLGWNLNDVYYSSAIEQIKKKVNHPLFFIFTDNLDYTKKHMFSNINKIICPSYDENCGYACGIYLIGHCKHVIISNSSYSWWGAWLNRGKSDRIIYAPKQWLPTKGLIKISYDDLIPDTWNCL